MGDGFEFRFRYVAYPYANAMSHTPSIKLRGLVKRYGKRAVVNGVTAEVKTGEIVGLLGPNGAGKTTTFYMVVGLVNPDEGTVLWPMARARPIAPARRCTRARARHRLSGPGELDFPQAFRRR